jgi:hypothetical protein
MKPVELLKNILLLVVSLALFLAAGEILTRLYQNITYRQWTGAGFGKIAKNRYLSCIDGKLGWRNQKNYRFASMERDYLGNQYLADIRTNEYGFRMFGDTANDNSPYTMEFKKISKDNNMHFVNGVPNSLRFFKKKGINVTVDRVHWNEFGHRVVAKKIIDYLEQHGLIR